MLTQDQGVDKMPAPAVVTSKLQEREKAYYLCLPCSGNFPTTPRQNAWLLAMPALVAVAGVA